MRTRKATALFSLVSLPECGHRPPCTRGSAAAQLRPGGEIQREILPRIPRRGRAVPTMQFCSLHPWAGGREGGGRVTQSPARQPGSESHVIASKGVTRAEQFPHAREPCLEFAFFLLHPLLSCEATTGHPHLPTITGATDHEVTELFPMEPELKSRERRSEPAGNTGAAPAATSSHLQGHLTAPGAEMAQIPTLAPASGRPRGDRAPEGSTCPLVSASFTHG